MFYFLPKVDPNLLDQKFLADLKALFATQPDDWFVTYGFRTKAEQDTLYKKYLKGGPRAAPPGKSPHEYGLAVDVVLDSNALPGLQPDWDDRKEAWINLFAAIKKHPRLKSGVSFGDGGHIERYQWQKFI